MHPFHEKCASAHWPDEACGHEAHTASVAIGYAMDLDRARRIDTCERIGAREGLRAVQAAATPAGLAARHNQVAQAWAAADRGDDDTAVLHGFMAVVRPVLARDFTEKQREKDEGKGDALPGGKLPIEDEQDLENAERLQGKVKGVPKSEISSYMKEKEEEFGHKQSAAAPAGGRLGFTEAAGGPLRSERTAASSLDQIQQVVDPDNQDTPQDDKLPDGVAFPINEGFAQQWVTGPGGAQPKGGQHEAATMNGLPTGAASLFGHLDALDGRLPHHRDSYPYSSKAHGAYLRSWNGTHAAQTAISGADPITREGYGNMTGAAGPVPALEGRLRPGEPGPQHQPGQRPRREDRGPQREGRPPRG